VRLDLNGDLVGGTTDPTRPNFQSGAYVIERLLQRHNSVLTALRGHTFECAIHNALSEAFFALNQNLVDELGHDG
jgi:hypothetical protein